jgi:hypothetical protein
MKPELIPSRVILSPLRLSPNTEARLRLFTSDEPAVEKQEVRAKERDCKENRRHDQDRRDGKQESAERRKETCGQSGTKEYRKENKLPRSADVIENTSRIIKIKRRHETSEELGQVADNRNKISRDGDQMQMGRTEKKRRDDETARSKERGEEKSRQSCREHVNEKDDRTQLEEDQSVRETAHGEEVKRGATEGGHKEMDQATQEREDGPDVSGKSSRGEDKEVTKGNAVEVENVKVNEDHAGQVSNYQGEAAQDIEAVREKIEATARKAWELLVFPKSATGVPLIQTPTKGTWVRRVPLQHYFEPQQMVDPRMLLGRRAKPIPWRLVEVEDIKHRKETA